MTFISMKRRMLFKLGVTLIILVGIVLFFIVDVEQDASYYQQITIDGRGEMAISIFDQEDPLLDSAMGGVVNEQRFASVEKDVGVNINDQIDREQNELLTNRHISHDKDSGDSDKDSESVKHEFYYDNSIPDQDSRNRKRNKKKIDLFDESEQKPVYSREFVSRDIRRPLVHLSVVVCENRAEEALTMLKSAAIVSSDVALVFHIVADKERQPVIKGELDSWPPSLLSHLSYHIYDIAFPHGPVTLTAWNKLYKPCASQRLFMPDRFQSVDSLIYVDTDTVFLQSVGALWGLFGAFNSTQLVGMVRESEDGTAGWYNRFASHPYYGDYGVNSGVMLMNLTRIRRHTHWLSVLQEDYERYRLAMTWGDQDLLNIYLSKHPDQVYLMTCDWNYRMDHCMYTSNCRLAETKGVSLLHASRGAFHEDKEPAFGAVYQAFRNVVLGPNQVSNLLSDLERRLKAKMEASSCGQVSSILLTQLSRLANGDGSQSPQFYNNNNGNNININDNKINNLINDNNINNLINDNNNINDNNININNLINDNRNNNDPVPNNDALLNSSPLENIRSGDFKFHKLPLYFQMQKVKHGDNELLPNSGEGTHNNNDNDNNNFKVVNNNNDEVNMNINRNGMKNVRHRGDNILRVEQEIKNDFDGDNR